MQELKTFNYLFIDNIETLPIPEDLNDLKNKQNWKDFYWQTYGLPLDYATYSLLDGKVLYLESLNNGQTCVRKQDFSGEVSICGSLKNEDKSGYHYILVYQISFRDGEVNNIKLVAKQPLSVKKLDDQVLKIREIIKKQSLYKKILTFFGKSLFFLSLGYIVYKVIFRS